MTCSGAPFHSNLRRYRRAVPQLETDTAEPGKRSSRAPFHTGRVYWNGREAEPFTSLRGWLHVSSCFPLTSKARLTTGLSFGWHLPGRLGHDCSRRGLWRGAWRAFLGFASAPENTKRLPASLLGVFEQANKKPPVGRLESGRKRQW